MLYAKTTICDCLKNRQPVSNAQPGAVPFGPFDKLLISTKFGRTCIERGIVLVVGPIYGHVSLLSGRMVHRASRKFSR